MKKHIYLNLISVLVVLLLMELTLLYADARLYSVTDLGTLGGDWCEACSINDLGQVVGWSGTSSEYGHAWVECTVEGFGDAVIDEQIRQALARLNRDYPYLKWGKFVGGATRYYKLTTSLTDWVVSFSYITKIIAPSPVVANEEEIEYLESKDWETYNDGTDEYLRLADSLSSTEYATVEYCIPWIIKDLDTAATTNLDRTSTEAIKYLSASLVCYSLSAQAAGSRESQMPGDFINYRSKQVEYKRAGDVFLEQYNITIGNVKGATKAAMVRRDFDPTLQYGGVRLTHYSTRR